MQRRLRKGQRSACRLLLLGAAVASAATLGGCSGGRSQSAVHPAGPAAEKIAELWWILLAVCTATFVLVLALLAIAILRPARSDDAPPPLGRHGFIVVGGIAFPAVVVVGLLLVSLDSMGAFRAPAQAPVIQVIAHQWWWEVRYPEAGVVTANEIRIPVGQPVRVELTSNDVVHSFWVPNLAGKTDNVPGLVNVAWLQADRPGRYRGQCAEYCGVQHALMAFVVVATSEDEYREWIRAQQQSARSAESAELREGEQVFFEAGCHNCHAVAGTRATGRVGPDLTHIDSRETLGAGTVPNEYGYLAGWVSNPHGIKPGNHMPATYLTPRELHVLVNWLESLR